jgi:hypothetical protein
MGGLPIGGEVLPANRFIGDMASQRCQSKFLRMMAIIRLCDLATTKKPAG